MLISASEILVKKVKKWELLFENNKALIFKKLNIPFLIIFNAKFL